MIDYVLHKAGKKQLTWVGHSTGNTQIFYGLSFEKARYFASKINLFVALAPLTRVDHVEPWLLQFMASHADTVKYISDKLGWYEIGATWAREGFKTVCGLTPSLCKYTESFFLTHNTELDDPDRFQVYMGHVPGGTSVRAYQHLAQNVVSGKFQLFDHGNSRKNVEEYGSVLPPEVRLKNIQSTDIKIAMFAGTEDEIGDVQDVRWARDILKTESSSNKESGTVVHYEEIRGGYSTFLVGMDMSYLRNLLKLMKQYNPILNPIKVDDMLY